MNLTLHDVDGGYRKRECEIETEKCSDILQLSSGPSQDAAEWSENSKNSKDSNADLTEEEWSYRIERSIACKCTLRKRGKGRQFLTSFDLGDHNKT